MSYTTTILLFVVLGVSTGPSFAQKSGEARAVDELNQLIDDAVVRKDIGFLEKHYADDFVFTHGTGHIDSKTSWIKNIRNMGEARFISRVHDSTVVEIHADVAVVAGKLSVLRQSAAKTSSTYGIRYVRVYARRNGVWQMISHRTTHEWH